MPSRHSTREAADAGSACPWRSRYSVLIAGLSVFGSGSANSLRGPQALDDEQRVISAADRHGQIGQRRPNTRGSRRSTGTRWSGTSLMPHQNMKRLVPIMQTSISQPSDVARGALQHHRDDATPMCRFSR